MIEDTKVSMHTSAKVKPVVNFAHGYIDNLSAIVLKKKSKKAIRLACLICGKCNPTSYITSYS